MNIVSPPPASRDAWFRLFRNSETKPVCRSSRIIFPGRVYPYWTGNAGVQRPVNRLGYMIFGQCLVNLRHPTWSPTVIFLRIRTRSANFFLALLWKNLWGPEPVFIFKKSTSDDVLYFKRVFRLFWQLFCQILPLPLLQNSRGHRPPPLYPLLPVDIVAKSQFNQNKIQTSHFAIHLREAREESAIWVQKKWGGWAKK